MVVCSQYFPSIPWMQLFLLQEKIEIEQYENYQKQGLRNRCKITGAENSITLSVPLIGGREQKTLMKDVRINNSSRWHGEHVKTIKSCYGKAPFFEYYFDAIEKILLKKHIYLLELNMDILNLFIQWFKWEGKLTFTTSFEKPQLLERPILQTPTYIQVFSDRKSFEPGLSILDVVFCVGPETKTLLTSSK